MTTLGAYAVLAVVHWLVIGCQGASLYDVYTEGGIINKNGSALVAEGPSFTLNGKDFRIFSGAIHYFRVPSQYWRDRIRKLKAVGCNTLETYVPWNLHEKFPGQYSFSDNLDLRSFLQIAQEEDLFVILRPGPYICSEWEFGGLPSWLLRNTEIVVRTSDTTYTDAVQKYYQQLIPLVTDLQFTHGGPIILVQVENEYGSYDTDDQPYLNLLKDTMTELGIIELYATSDSAPTDAGIIRGSLPGVLMTANFQSDPDRHLNQLQSLQPDRPLMVMEFWTGWFDHWGASHSTVDPQTFLGYFSTILSRGASFSFYMFHGGTSYGYMNGANTDSTLLNVYLPDVTSYDYDALITEAGDYTEKYDLAAELIANYTVGQVWDVPLPQRPTETTKSNYGQVSVTKSLSLSALLALINPEHSDASVLPMELLDTYGNSGQNFGFTVYRTTVDIPQEGAALQIAGRVRDYGLVILSDVVAQVVEHREKDVTVDFTSEQAGNQQELDILIENSGRVNFGLKHDFAFNSSCKGLFDPVNLQGEQLFGWDTFALDFNPTLLNLLKTAEWEDFSTENTYPRLLQATLTIDGTPNDTFLDTGNFTKGIVIVNDFVLGRYWDIGPQRRLYLPAPLLVTGENLIYVFELRAVVEGSILFSDQPDLG